jgi:hypothetical protein
MKTFTFFICISLWSFLTQAQYNSSNSAPSSSNLVRSGFYFSAAMGPAFGGINGNDNSGNTLKVAGTGVDIDIQVGGSISDNLFLHGTMLIKTISSPVINDVKLSGNYYFDESMIGAGVTRYFNDNYFITGNMGFGNYSFQEGNTTYTTDNGLTIQIKGGREWWISNRWLLGISLQYSHLNLTSRPAGSVIEKWDGNRFAICLYGSFIRHRSDK